MGTEPRTKPKHLPAKLRAIRKGLGASQAQMVKLLNLKVSPARVSEWERGIREPDLIVLLAFARAAGVKMEDLVDDRLKLPKKRF